MTGKLLIFTDLDGSLLDHYNYSHQASDSMLRSLEEEDIPVIFATSKTRSELIALRRTLSNRHPFIVENGGAAFIPEDYFPMDMEDVALVDGFWMKRFCQERQHWLDLIEDLRATFDGAFVTFAESTIQQVAEMTGLTPIEAELAAQREFGEPLLWKNGELERQWFIKSIEQAGGRVLTGGRFMHISGNTDKGKALLWLKKQYLKRHPDCLAIAIGDSNNDVAMLEAADQALIVRSPAHAPPKLTRTDRLYISRQYGPEGWVEGMKSVLSAMSVSQIN